MAAYEVVLGTSAIRTVLSLPDPERKELAGALRTELLDGPNADKEVRFDSDVKVYSDRGAGPGKAVYTATPLSFAGYTAVHRSMTKEELRRLRRDQGLRVARQGLYVLDILRTESPAVTVPPKYLWVNAPGHGERLTRALVEVEEGRVWPLTDDDLHNLLAG